MMNVKKRFQVHLFVWKISIRELNAKTYIGLGYVERVPDYWELFSTANGNKGMSKPTFTDLDTEKTLQLDTGYQ